jgi:hypothetical protein
VLRRIFLPKREEVSRDWRRLDDEILNLYASRRMRWAGHVARMRAIRNLYSVVIGELDGKRQVGR